jgi:hypothetical protein
MRVVTSSTTPPTPPVGAGPPGWGPTAARPPAEDGERGVGVAVNA